MSRSGCVSLNTTENRVEDERRCYYRITELGRQAFATELKRYNEVVSIADQSAMRPIKPLLANDILG